MPKAAGCAMSRSAGSTRPAARSRSARAGRTASPASGRGILRRGLRRDEREQGGWGRRAVLPGAVLVKAHMPDLATVVPIFNVESLEATPRTCSTATRAAGSSSSLDFNKRFIATVPRDHDPIALRELFSPAFIDWTTRLPARVDFGITEQQLFHLAPARSLGR